MTGGTILVADDDALVRDIVTDILETHGYTVLPASDGREAATLFHRTENLAMIISDMNMPGMNGMDLIREVRRRDAAVPIVVLTGDNEVELVGEAIAAGANDYLLKDENIPDTIMISVRKVFEKKQIEDENRELLARLQGTLARMTAIIETMADGLLVTDARERVAATNPAVAALLGLPRSALDGRELDSLPPALGALVRESRTAPRGVAAAEIPLAHNRVGKAVATAIRQWREGTMIDGGSVVVIRDVTAEKEIDRMKSDFISTISHELRTPLTSVMGFARIIQRKFNDVIAPRTPRNEPKVQRALSTVTANLGIILSEGERLMKLINDILDLAKIEAGKIEWKDEPVSIPDLVQRALNATHGLFAEKQTIEVRSELEHGLPMARGDGDRLLQVLINLLSNAVKFTERGSVTVAVRLSGHNEIEVSVADTGAGISPADRPRIFEKFKQVGDVTTAKSKGTGLGLPICREIVEHHGGRIWVEGDLGTGSTFFFTLPVDDRDRGRDGGDAPDAAADR